MFLCLFFTALLAASFTSASRIPNLDGRIYNGFVATIEEFPYQAQLLRGTKHFCGATIVGRPGSTFTYVAITAAQCIYGDLTNFRIRAGVTHMSEVGQLAKIKTAILHPDFDRKNYQGDIAILILETPITFNEKAQPAYLPEYNEKVAPETKAFASGWGIVEDGIPAFTLRAVELIVFSSEKCAKIYGSEKFTDKNLCAGGTAGNVRGICGNDGGGPLVSNEKLIGIISRGQCGDPQYPDVFTNIENLRPWIDSVVKLN